MPPPQEHKWYSFSSLLPYGLEYNQGWLLLYLSEGSNGQDLYLSGGGDRYEKQISRMPPISVVHSLPFTSSSSSSRTHSLSTCFLLDLLARSRLRAVSHCNTLRATQREVQLPIRSEHRPVQQPLHRFLQSCPHRSLSPALLPPWDPSLQTCPLQLGFLPGVQCTLSCKSIALYWTESPF